MRSASSGRVGGAVHAGAVDESFRQMRAAHGGGTVEVGDGAGELQHPVIAARRKGEAFGGFAHQGLRAGVGRGQFLDRARRRGGVGGDAGKADRGIALGLLGALGGDAAGDLGRAFGRRRQDEVGCNTLKYDGPKTA